MNYLKRGSLSNISYIVHQFVGFSTCPKKEHGKAIRWLVRYLLHARDKGTILTPNMEKHMEINADADLVGNYHFQYT